MCKSERERLSMRVCILGERGLWGKGELCLGMDMYVHERMCIGARTGVSACMCVSEDHALQ